MLEVFFSFFFRKTGLTALVFQRLNVYETCVMWVRDRECCKLRLLCFIIQMTLKVKILTNVNTKLLVVMRSVRGFFGGGSGKNKKSDKNA